MSHGYVRLSNCATDKALSFLFGSAAPFLNGAALFSILTEVQHMRIGAVILAGGKSRRMGTDKAELLIDNQIFLDKIASELSAFDELLVSVGSKDHLAETKYQTVADKYPDCGPIGGLQSALSVCTSDALFAISCDVPLFKAVLAQFICSKMSDDFDAVIALSPEGFFHPLCAVYKKSVADIFEKFILLGDYKILNAYEQMKIFRVPVEDFEDLLLNVNTPEEYECLISKTKP